MSDAPEGLLLKNMYADDQNPSYQKTKKTKKKTSVLKVTGDLLNCPEDPVKSHLLHESLLIL